MFEKIKSPDTIPMEGDAFNIDKDIKEAIVLISKKAGTSTVIVDPSGNKYSPAKFAKNIQWYETSVFDMITIKDPAVGNWKVNFSVKEGNKIFIITNLNLKSSFDRSFVHKNDRIKIDAWLEKDGGMLKEKDVLEQVSFFAEIAGPDGKSARLNLKDSGAAGDDKAGDGIYSNEFIITSDGEYTVKIIAESKTFKREKALQLKTAGPTSAQPAEQKKEPVQAAKKSPASEGDLWEKALIKFGIINVSLLVIILVVFLINKEARKKSDKKGKKKGGAPKKS
ncbi:MAG: hypothetical protein HY099_01090 [Nitrospirae bacterium]|nr:hypothetical protein [Nitrospirota bacterium]